MICFMKRVIISGYFNPLHGGHLNLIEAAKRLGDQLIVIVANDKQQLAKKGKIILDEQNRMRLMKALREVDEVVLGIDNDPSCCESLVRLARKYPDDELIFANGGDRGDKNSADPIPEIAVAKKYRIKLVFGVGDTTKFDSSTRINKAVGWQ